MVHEGSQVSDWVTLSCGVAVVFKGALLSPLELIERSDRALYEAKASGRDRVAASFGQARSHSEDADRDESEKAA